MKKFDTDNNRDINSVKMTNKRKNKVYTIKRFNRFLLLGISLIIMIIDQITKYVVRHNFSLYEVKVVNDYWNWTLAYNKGAAFSFLANHGTWPKIFFGVIAVLVSIGIVYYILNRSYSYLAGFGLSFILGGAIGNLIDRIILGKVTDFIDWHYESYHFATFNFADSTISVGVVLLIFDSLFCSSNKSTK